MRSGWTRREFLAATNAAALLLLLESCTAGPLGKSGTSSQPSGDLIKQALTTLRDALRASPDHLAHRAEAVVAGKDSAKIVAFVRDSLGVIPPWGSTDDTGAVRWGGAAALRGGQGTLRERADILADLLTRAGFKATVMAANRPSAVDLRTMYRQRALKFSPDAGKLDATRTLLRQAGTPSPPPEQVFNPGPDPVAAIEATLPAGLRRARTRSDLLPDVVPVVQFQEGGKNRYAFALGDLGISDSAPAGLRNAGDTGDAPVVSVTVSALAEPAVGSTTQGGHLIDLVSGSWRADRVVGKQVILTFSPPQGAKAVLDFGLAALPVRVPFLRVQTDPSTAPDPTLIAAGSLVTVQGDVLGPSTTPVAAPGTPSPGPYGPYITLTDADRLAAESRVATIKVSANASAFPEVELLMDVSDSSGASVDGLDARSFGVKDGSAPLTGLAVYSNSRTVMRPRVLVVYDNFSGWWPNAGAKAQFDSALASAIAGQAAQKPFDVQAVGLGAAPSPDGWSPPDSGKLAAFFASVGESADDQWGTFGGAALDQAVSAIICVSDFNKADGDPNKLDTYRHRLISAHVPVLAIPVGQNGGQFDGATATEVVSLTGGQTFPATANGATAAATAAGALLKTWVGNAYRLRYTVSPGGPSHHDVFVSVTGRSTPVGQTAYDVPALPVPPPSFAGLYVTISVGGLQAVRRLAGVEINDRGGPLTPTGDSAAIAETRAAMDGITTIAFEPGSPTSSAILDDMLSSALDAWPVKGLAPGSSSDSILKALPTGIKRLPLAFASVLRTTEVDPAGLSGLKVAIMQERVLGGSLEQHVDLAIGVNPVVPITTDQSAAFTAVLKTSVAACAAEAATFPVSAYGNLSGVALKPIAANDFGARDGWLAGLAPDQLAVWRPALIAYEDFHRLVPSDPKGAAMWVIDPLSGVAKAVLLDGTGGATIRTSCLLSNADFLAIALGMLSLLCMAVPNFSCVGVNVGAAGMTAAAMFSHPFNPLDPLALVLAARPLQSVPMNAAFGIMLMLIVFENAGCFGP